MAFDRLILFIHLFFHRFAVETGGSGACEVDVYQRHVIDLVVTLTR